MRFLRAFLLSALVLEATCMQEGIAVVENIVADIIASQANYVHFHSNQTNSTIQGASSSSNLLKERSTPYWYESITHQGISAFGPSGYTVYRNVKDYGAKGMSNRLSRSMSITILTNLSRRRINRRYSGYQQCYICRRSLWSRVCINHNYPCSGLLSGRDIQNFFFTCSLLLHAANWKS
jgi:hypothetical protein